MRHLNHLFHFTIMQGGLEHGIKDIVIKIWDGDDVYY